MRSAKFEGIEIYSYLAFAQTLIIFLEINQSILSKISKKGGTHTTKSSKKTHNYPQKGGNSATFFALFYPNICIYQEKVVPLSPKWW